MKIKELQHWSEDVGMTAMPWHNKDWESVLNLLSKILADDLSNRKNAEEEHGEVTFKISFDALLQIAEDILGIPHIVVEEDLSTKYPNVNLALLTYMLCVKQSLSGIDTKIIRDSIAPKLVFEANTTAEQLPSCVSCGLFAFLVERVIVDRKVWHRRCFLCSTCNKQLYRGSYRSIENGQYECVEHFAANILSKFAINSGSSDSGMGSAGSSRRPMIAHKPRISGDESAHPFDEDPSLNRRLSEMSTGTQARFPPPRPPPPNLNRVSAIIQKQMQVHVDHDQIKGKDIISEVVEIQQVGENDGVKIVENLKIEVKPTPKPRSNVPSVKGSSPCSLKKADINKYPGTLNPFGTDDEEDDDIELSSSEDEYNESLNPFADEDVANENKPEEAKLHQRPPPSPQPSLKAERPKLTPPPPPKPPRSSLIPQSAEHEAAINRITTLPRAKKTFRAPPPPIPVKRKIEFTENKSFETLEAIVDELRRVKAEHERLEMIGRNIEKEILFKLGKEAIEWKKDKKVDDWVAIIEQKCSAIRREAVLIHVWLEKYLNEIHADTEYQLRCVLERNDGKDRSQEDVSREAELLEVLVDIMSLKNGMIESGVDPNSLLDSQSSKSAKTNISKIKKMKSRLKKLKKKI
uniref:LIM zinc-binding domain-containing protein n=1 Tax=Panagrolaimus superbus TaxID=310955 RepID=A0A914YC10_9BILA